MAMAKESRIINEEKKRRGKKGKEKEKNKGKEKRKNIK
jgi:hypothetical protein